MFGLALSHLQNFSQQGDLLQDQSALFDILRSFIIHYTPGKYAFTFPDNASHGTAVSFIPGFWNAHPIFGYIGLCFDRLFSGSCLFSHAIRV
jgi:hypothetical protein